MTLFEEKRAGIPCVKIEGIENFDVSKIFDCGQCFRFNKLEHSVHENEFSGIAYGRFISVGQDEDSVVIYNSNIDDYCNIWKNYLAIDVDYNNIAHDILSRSENEALRCAVERGRGIRILHQEPWEAICSFIVSQNNNIPRIKKIIEAMSESCGDKIEIPEGMEQKVTDGTKLYSFPTPEALEAIGTDGLFALKTGFRAKYIYDAAYRAVHGDINYEEILASDNTAECVNELCKIKGVGPKVASCALLFGFAKYDAFPVDVWIKKVIAKYFAADGESFEPDALGKYAGIAQQYLFYYERYLNS